MNDDLQIITQQIDVLIKLVASGLLFGKKQQEQIDLLSKSGLSPKKIAGLIGTTPNTVRVGLSTLRNAKRKSKK
jgi:DNA-binding CsgD family transcriptional regulator